MRIGTPVFIVIPNKWRKADEDPEFVKVPGIVMSEAIPSSYVNRNTGATVQTAQVEIISLRDTTGQHDRGRRWFQSSTEPVNLLVRRFGNPISGLDVAEDGNRIAAQALWGKVEESVIDLRRRQQAARIRAERPEPAIA